MTTEAHPGTQGNTAWALEDFVDSLVVELDKTRETLAVKSINKPLSYSVKEMSLDLNAFPTYDGDKVRFTTARPGEEGASKVSIQLGSITDQQVRATSRPPERPPAGQPVARLDDVDPATRKSLRKLGVSSVEDLRKLEARNVDLGQVTDDAIDYTQLAQKLRKSERRQRPPAVDGVALSTGTSGPVLVVEGKNLGIDPTFPPVAVVNERLCDVVASTADRLVLALPASLAEAGDNELVVTFDPYAVVRLNVRA